MNTRYMKTRAISVVEVVIVVMVIGVLAAMAIPQYSQAAVNQTQIDLKTNLAVLRTAIEMYAQDHGAYPGQRGIGDDTAPAGTPAAFVRQLTLCSDAEGCVGESRSDRFHFGPYLRDGVPLNPVAVGRPSAEILLIDGDAAPGFDAAAPHTGWIYNFETGYIAANSPGVDDGGARYDSY